MGPYGAVRALVIFPASWGLYCHRTAITEWFSSPLFNLWRAQRVIAVARIMFGTQVLMSAVLTTLHLSSSITVAVKGGEQQGDVYCDSLECALDAVAAAGTPGTLSLLGAHLY